MGRRRDGSYQCDECKGSDPPGIRITALPVFGGKPGGWRVSCLAGHEIPPLFGIDIIVKPAG